MTTTNIAPNGTVAVAGIGSAPTITGGATAHAVTADASDATYVEFIVDANPIILDFGTFTLPTGAIIIQTTNNYRAAISGVSSDLSPVFDVHRYGSTSYVAAAVTGSIADYTNLYTDVAGVQMSTQADIDGFEVWFYNSNPGSTVRLYKASVDIKYVPIPTATATAPTGSITTTLSPTASWTHTPGSDAPGGQTAYQVKIFTAAVYGGGGFSADTSSAAYDTGTVSGSATSVVVGPLANSTTYRAYVRTAQTTTGTTQWSDWSNIGFSTSVTTSDITSVVATADNTNGRHSIVVTRTSTTPCWTVLEVQSSYDAGTTWDYVRGYTAYAIPGQAVTATAATDLVNLTAHGLSAGATVVFSGLTGGAGLTAATTYFVIASGLTSSAFKVSTTSGGGAVNITSDMTAGTMQSALTVTLNDNEAPNGTACTYRARATYVSGGIITGAWTTSSTATWTSTTVRLKDVQVPARNMVVSVEVNPEPVYARPQGVFKVIGATYPVVVSDTQQAGTSVVTILTSTAADETALKLVASGTVLLLQFPTTSGFGWGNRYVVPGALQELRVVHKLNLYRRWELTLTEVARPADTGIT